MARIKITGYVDTDDLNPEDVDLEHEMGLSSEGYDNLVTGENGRPLSLTALEDVEVTLESD